MMTQFKTVQILTFKFAIAFLFVIQTQAQVVEHEDTLAVPFGPLAQTLQSTQRLALDKIVRTKDCDQVGTNQDTRPERQQYRCGEYPIGIIVDDQWKLLDSMDLGKEFSQDKGKNQFHFKNAKGGAIKLHMFMSRRQSSDKVEINTLREFGKENVELSRRFGLDQYLKLNPKDGALETEACLYGPGVKARASDVRLKGKIRRKDAFCFIFCADATAEGTIDIDFGDVEIQSLKACLDLKTQMVNNKPVVSMTENGEIHFEGIKHKGLKVKANMKATDWISKVLEFFGVEVSDMISKAVAKAVKKETGSVVEINLNKIKSGAYFKEYLHKAKLKPLVKALNKEIKAAYQEHKPEERITNLIRDVLCVSSLNTTDFSPSERRELIKACRVSAKLNVLDFKSDNESRSMGCYKNALPIRATAQDSEKQQQWKQSCVFGVHYALRIEVEMSKLGECMLHAWNLNKEPSVSCKAELAKLAQEYSEGDLDAYLEHVTAKVLPQLKDEDIALIRQLSQTQLGIAAPSVDVLKSLLNN